MAGGEGRGSLLWQMVEHLRRCRMEGGQKGR